MSRPGVFEVIGSLALTTVCSLVVTAWGQPQPGNSMLRYNATSKQLHFNCSVGSYDKTTHVTTLYEKNRILYVNLVRRKGDVDVILANWTSGKGIALSERVAIESVNNSPYLPEVVLSHVTCYDTADYSCYMLDNPSGKHTQMVNISQSFYYQGEVTGLRVRPLQSRYAAGTTIQLTCSANVWQPNSPIVWESRLPEEQFAPINSTDQPINPKDHVSTDQSKRVGTEPLCGVTTTSSHTHTLTPADDNREWRCRLSDTTNEHQQASYIVAVKFDTGPCKPETTVTSQDETSVDTTKKLIPSTRMRSQDESTPPDVPSIQTVLTVGSSSWRQWGDMPHIILLSLVAFIAVSVIVSVVVMVRLVKTRTKAGSVTAPSSDQAYLPPALPPAPHPCPNPDTYTYLVPRLQGGDETAPKDQQQNGCSCCSTSTVFISDDCIRLMDQERCGAVYDEHGGGGGGGGGGRLRAMIAGGGGSDPAEDRRIVLNNFINRQTASCGHCVCDHSSSHGSSAYTRVCNNRIEDLKLPQDLGHGPMYVGHA